MAAATAAALKSWLAARGDQTAPPRMLDLGCGDLALLAPLLRHLPLASYTGLDLSARVLPLAQQALGKVPYPCHWVEADLLAWAGAPAGGSEEHFEIIHSAFAIHHLSDSEKPRLLDSLRRRIAPGGLFLWVDVFREPGESRDAYVQRYLERIASSWQPLSAEQQQHVGQHLASYDIPADRAAIEAAAEAAGWQWQWAWKGQHRAEALAVLTPC